MNNQDHYGSDQFRPLSAWAYVGYSILFIIPIIGWIFLIILSANSNNINRCNFARSYWCFLFLAVLIVSISAFGGYTLFSNLSSENPGVPEIRETAKNSETTVMPKAETTEITDVPAVTSKPTETTKPTATPKPTDAPKSEGVSAEFKAAMDSYEAFFIKYVDFMKKYKESNNDVGMLIDYTSMMAQYVDTISKMEAIDDSNLSTADAAYHLKVTARIYKKLAEIAL